MIYLEPIALPQVVDLSRGTLTQDMRPTRLAVMLKTCETFIRSENGWGGQVTRWFKPVTEAGGIH